MKAPPSPNTLLVRSFFKKPHTPPSVRGLFVNSHAAALHMHKGAGAVRTLAERFGRAPSFDTFALVPVRDEITLLELCVDILSDGAYTGAARAKEAGRLHFRNFKETALGAALMRSLPRTAQSFNTLLHNAPSIGRIVFDALPIACDDVREGAILTLGNCDYPIEHFEGFFEEWMRSWSIAGTVSSRAASSDTYEYRITFL